MEWEENKMNCMEDFLKAIVDEMKKDIPADVITDLEELSRLETDVHLCLVRNRIIDTKKIKRINELVRKHYYHGEKDWLEETVKPKTFDFGEAIRRVKKGARVARKGWNGKDQYIALGIVFSVTLKYGTGIVPAHEDIGNEAIVFFGTRGQQIGWLASQADMLADDWYEVENDG